MTDFFKSWTLKGVLEFGAFGFVCAMLWYMIQSTHEFIGDIEDRHREDARELRDEQRQELRDLRERDVSRWGRVKSQLDRIEKAVVK